MKLYFILILISSLNYELINSAEIDWGYTSSSGIKGPLDWKDNYPTCGGSFQSPLDIQTTKAQYVKNMKPIVITKLSATTGNVSLEKHPTSIYLTFNNYWTITFGGDKCLRPIAIHWHWGSNSNQGSEHKLNSYVYPIEGHLVSYNCEKYSSSSIAQNSSNGLYVIGFFYKLGSDNPAISQIFSYIDPIISNQTNSINISEIGPNVILPITMEQYYQYDGSLTSPPCTENVRWTVLKDELSISTAQLNKFRQLNFEPPLSGKMVDNFRPTIPNPNNIRIVYSSFQTGLKLNWSSMTLCLEVIVVFIFTKIDK